MWGAVLDLLFNVIVERALLGTGARLLWLARLGRMPLEEQLQRTAANLCTGALVWAALLVLLLRSCLAAS